MKSGLITFILLFSFGAFAQQAPNDDISKAMADVQKVNDPLEEALNAQQSKSQNTELKKTPSAADIENQNQQLPQMRKIEIKNGAETAAPTKKEEQKKPSNKLSKEESDLLKMKFRSLKDRPDLVKEIEDEKKQMSAVYSPAPTRDKSEDGYVIERDSTKVITKKMSVTDSLNLKICFNAGVQITLDEDISTALQTIILDDKIFFDAMPFDNNRGAYIRLKQPVPPGMYWESSIRMVRKLDDKSYLINLYALPCPEGPYPFPKIVYLKEKYSVLNKHTKVMTPEDTIISMSDGLPRVQRNRIRVYDMVASSGSDWVVFGVEIQFPSRKAKGFDADLSKYFKVLDNLQINGLGNRVEYLPLQSEKATQSRGVPTMRFKVMVNIDKTYILNNKYIHMMFVDKEEGHYQYVRVDTLPYFLSLKKRGFEL